MADAGRRPSVWRMPTTVREPSRFERVFETWLFRARWLLAPIYAGMVVALAALVVVFGIELTHTLGDLLSAHPKYTLVTVIQLVDVSLAASLVLVVVLSGYRNFISEGHGEEADGAPRWMGAIDFAGLKLKLMSSLIAISGVALLKAFVLLTDEEKAPDERHLAWMIGIHMTFVISALLLALTDLLTARSHGK
jgi:uncharacterized protein (TIGR00645 family)